MTLRRRSPSTTCCMECGGGCLPQWSPCCSLGCACHAAPLRSSLVHRQKVKAEAEAWQGRAEQAVHDLAEAKAQHRALMDSAAALAQRHTTMEYWVADIAKSLLQTPAALARLAEARTACLQVRWGAGGMHPARGWGRSGRSLEALAHMCAPRLPVQGLTHLSPRTPFTGA